MNTDDRVLMKNIESQLFISLRLFITAADTTFNFSTTPLLICYTFYSRFSIARNCNKTEHKTIPRKYFFFLS